MERVAFLLERTNERLVCLLNPENLVIRRIAGVQPRRSAGGQVSGVGLSDDPLLFTGGGRTELELDLLFDVGLAGSTIAADDVRDLTGPLWNLAENAPGDDGYGQPPLVRFVWGKYWNIPGVIASAAERLEEFTADGAPQRSWLRLRMLRVREPMTLPGGTAQTAVETEPLSLENLNLEEEIPVDRTQSHEVVAGDRLDEIAFRYYGDSTYWRLLAVVNDLEDPNTLPPGLLLLIPPAPELVWRLLTVSGETAEPTHISFTSLLRLGPSPLRVAL